ncbi:2OG-Fe(II) oxygenase [Sandaracinus amylolyticus]|uniref:2OG-Fe(II) oxygenase n=1 Tax=Sandaracinus amylolyticus TaxID=927083 RepID=UPI001F1EFC3E|nr:2OG-Fe(II) oxygenase [Sandaracinus amylolyticus]UJR84378.1 Hypothetical protein I5071_64570 [Sandaracinus amylolyticus]
MAAIDHAAANSLEVLTLDVDELERHPDLIADIYRRRLMGVVVRGAFASAHMAEVVANVGRLEGVPRAVAPTFKGGLFGSPLVMASEDLRDYLDGAQRFRDSTRELFAPAGGLEARIEHVMGRIAGGLPVDVARDDAGRGYLPASIRVLVEGDSLPLHYENGTTRYASMKQLLPRLDVATIMSFYVAVALPEEGGVLEVFSTDCTDGGDRILHELGGPERARPILAARGCVEVRPGVGDMLVFDAGRYYHLVSEVRSGTRWTLGGFFAFDRDHTRVLYWS